MGISETDVNELASFLKAKKKQGQRIELFLGHKTGKLYCNNLYEALKSRTSVAGDLLNLLKHDTSIVQELSKWLQHIQLLDELPASTKFKECYGFLSRHFSENGIHSILFSTLKLSRSREEDELMAKLIEADFFNTILLTSFDTFLEDACDLLGMKKPSDYGVFICGSDESTTLEKSGGNSIQIVKVFGDFDSLNYKTVGNEFELEADQPLKKFLITEMSKEVVVLGYDSTWDKALEKTFQEAGEKLWYINEELPAPNTYLAHVLNRRSSYFIGGSEWSYSSFLQALFNLIGEVSWEPEIKSTLPISPLSHDSIRKKAFISYSHKDKEYLERLQVHLKGFLHTENENDDLDYRDDIWADTQIPPGAEWKEEIKKSLNHAKLAVLLISADFLSSDFIRQEELPVLYEAAQAGEVQIVSVLIGPSAFAYTPLSRYQAINSDTELLMGMEREKQELVWNKLAELVFKNLTAKA